MKYPFFEFLCLIIINIRKQETPRKKAYGKCQNYPWTSEKKQYLAKAKELTIRSFLKAKAQQTPKVYADWDPLKEEIKENYHL